MLLQYVEESKRWRNRFLFVSDAYKISNYESKQVIFMYRTIYRDHRVKSAVHMITTTGEKSFGVPQYGPLG